MFINMQREYLILVGGDKNFGAVKVQPASKGLRLEIDIERSVELDEESVFKAYAVYPSLKETDYLGVLEGYKGDFNIDGGKGAFGVAITRKNTAKGNENFFCCCSEDGRLDVIEEVFKGGREPKKESDKRVEGKTASSVPEPQEKERETKEFVKEYLASALKKLEKITEGFTSEKVNGYYLRGKNRIIESVMANDKVYKAVMRYGYYIFSTKADDTGEQFIVSIPVSAKEGNPFEGYEKYAFEVKSDIPGDMNFYCIAAGSDKQGDFFLKEL